MTNIYVNFRLGRDWQRLVTSRNYIEYSWQGMQNKGCCFVVALPEVSQHSKPQSKALAHAVAKPTPAPPEPPPKIWPQNRAPHKQQSTRRDFEENSKTFKIFQNKESFDWTNFDSSNPKLKSLKSESVKSASDLQCGFACHRESRHARHIDNLHFVSVHDYGHGSHSGGHNIPILVGMCQEIHDIQDIFRIYSGYRPNDIGCSENKVWDQCNCSKSAQYLAPFRWLGLKRSLTLKALKHRHCMHSFSISIYQ